MNVIYKSPEEIIIPMKLPRRIPAVDQALELVALMKPDLPADSRQPREELLQAAARVWITANSIAFVIERPSAAAGTEENR